MIYDEDFRGVVQRYCTQAGVVAACIFALAAVYFAALFLLTRFS